MATMTASFRRLLPLVLLVVPQTETRAHKLEVATLRIVETGPQSYSLRYEVPLGLVADYPAPTLPGHAAYIGDAEAAEGPVHLEFLTTDRPLAAGDSLLLDWNREGVLASAIWRSGSRASAYFPRGPNGIRVEMDDLRAGSGTWVRSASRYIPLGFEHILKGIDHLFFVAGLLLLARGLVPLLLTISAFTVAHSLTLGLSLFGVFRLDAGLVDLIVAMSIVFLAVEIVYCQDGRPTLAARFPWAVAFFFGLVHGLGFAGALEAMGLQNESIPLILLFFNVGVELGQLAFVGVWLAALASARTLGLGLPRPLAKWPAYALGVTASVWFLLRLGGVTVGS